MPDLSALIAGLLALLLAITYRRKYNRLKKWTEDQLAMLYGLNAQINPKDKWGKSQVEIIKEEAQRQVAEFLDNNDKLEGSGGLAETVDNALAENHLVEKKRTKTKTK